ncbi:MAG: UvrB/UvrC motif-containing protein [Pirellulales bacterium]
MLEQEMPQAAEDLEPERAASLRDKLMQLRDQSGEKVAEAISRVTDSRGREASRLGGKGSGAKGSGGRIPRPARAIAICYVNCTFVESPPS